MKFSIKDFFGKCEQIHRKLRVWSHLLKKPLMENFIFCAVFNTFITILEYDEYLGSNFLAQLSDASKMLARPVYFKKLY